MKPWSKEECLKWYVESAEANLKQLSALSEVPYSTLKKWSAAEKWSDQRAAFQSQLTQTTRIKTIEKTSEHLSEDLATLAIEHWGNYRTCREIASYRVKTVLSRIERLIQTPIVSHPENDATSEAAFAESVAQQITETIDPAELNLLSQVIDRCVKGERLSLSMEYLDLNNAVAAIEKTGLKVVVPNDSTLVKVSTKNRDDRADANE